LIVNEIGREATNGEIASSLADDFVRRSKTDEMYKTLDDDNITIVHIPAHGLIHRHYFGLFIHR